MINDSEVGDFDIRVTSSLECLLPWNLLRNDGTVSVRFAHPFATSRSAVNGEPDERLIALAFQRISLRKLQEIYDEKGGTAPPCEVDHGEEQTSPLPATAGAGAREGHVDVFGYYPSTRFWVFVGWVSQTWTDADAAVAVTARFDDRDESGPIVAGFYDRAGLQGRGRGFVLAMAGKASKRQLGKSRLLALQADTIGFSLAIDGHGKEPVRVDQLSAVLRPILRAAVSEGGFEALLTRLPPDLVVDMPRVLSEGHIDTYTYDRSLGGWMFLGWLSQPWTKTDAPRALARFDDREVAGDLLGACYEREDVRGRGLGCLLFLRDLASTSGAASSLQSLRIDTATSREQLKGPARAPIPIRAFTANIQPLLDDAPSGSQLAELGSMLGGGARPAILPASFEGHIDFCGYHSQAAGWLFCGWVTLAWADDEPPLVIAQFVDGDVTGQAIATFYHRGELNGRGVGIVFLLPSDIDKREQLLSVEMEFAAFTTTIQATDRDTYGETELLDALRPILLNNELQPDRGGLRALLFDERDAPTAPAATEIAQPLTLEGHVDFYGYHPVAEAWLFCGWVSKPWGDGDKPRSVVARFERGAVSSGTTLATFYYRDDIEGRGVGFVLSLASPDGDRNHLISLDLDFTDCKASLPTTAAGPSLQPHELGEWLAPLLTGGEANSNRARLQAMLSPAGTEASRRNAAQGFVDVYGYHSIAGGWLFCGWVSNEAQDAASGLAVTAQFERGEVRGEAVSVHYPRDDLGDRGMGVVLFVPGTGNPLGGLLSVAIEAAGLSFRIYPGLTIQRLREQELISSLRGIVAGAPVGLPRDVMLAILGRQGFTGADTVGELSERIFLELDEAIFCEPDGIVLIGWYLAKPGAVRHIRLRCGPLVSAIDLDDSLKVERADVLSAVGREHGFDDSRCGFIVFLPHAVDGANTPYIEIETRRGEVGYRLVPAPKLEGIAATRRLLECFDVRFLDVPRAYDRVIGPAVECLNKSRLKVRPNVTALEFGTPPADPQFSVIIPLYGRIDFVEYQIALFSAHQQSRDFEFIYLLDDPPKRREAQFLFTSVFERFRMPFRALLFDRNMGFAPTNNIGLQYARGDYVCYLNSDAFPGTPDWLERLAARLTAHPELGVVGPLLLYEDGSIQHQGMSFRRLNEFGGWHFGHHPGKGMQLGDANGMRRCISITGACMLMRRTLAERLHGFDESYAIGDFEDSDLCLRLYRMGLACAVDLDVHLFHLERKSQAGSAANWRMNLTLYNAWFHERRWARAIAAHPQAHAPTPFGGELPADDG